MRRNFIAIIAVLFMLFTTELPADAREHKRVLVLYSLDRQHPGHELTDQGIRSVFDKNSSFDVQVFVENLELGRFAAPAQMRAMVDLLRYRYADTRFDAIITVYPDALDFLIREENRLFPGVPIVACEITRAFANELDTSPLRHKVTGTVVADDMTGLLNDMFRLRPGTRHIALISGTAPIDNYGEQVCRKGLAPFKDRVELIDLTKLSLEDTLSRVRSLPPDAVIFYEGIVRDGLGRTYVPREVLSRISRAANVPVFGQFDSFLGFGIVGGRLSSFGEQGKEAARLALRVLAGEEPEAIPWGGAETYINAFDWRELRRWGIPKTAVLSGSDLRYYTPTFWEAHRWAVVGAVALFSLEAVLILGLLFNIRQRRLIQRSLRESEEQVRLAADAAGAGLWNMDIGTGQLWATRRARELFGFTPDEPVTFGKVIDVVHPEDRQRVRQATQRARETGNDAYVEYRLLLSGGTVRWIAVRGKVSRPESESEPLLLMGACTDITARKTTEVALRRHEHELAALAGRLIHNQEEELRRLSRELHDDLTQRLAVLAIDAGLLEKSLMSKQTATAAGIRMLKNRLIEISNDVHHLSRQLHPAILDDLGLVQAARMECESFRKRTRIDLTFTAGDLPTQLSPDRALCLYRVLQEALQNLGKHSQASEAHVSLEAMCHAITLTIQDFGVGFDIQRVSGSGIGLSSMQERVRLVKGVLTIDSEPGEGTMIEVRVPIGEMSDVSTTDTACR